MVEVLKTAVFTEWFDKLQDRQAKRLIQAKIDYLRSVELVGPSGSRAL